MQNSNQLLITLGDYDWYPLKRVGSKILLLSESVLFKGYYSLSSCDYSDSKVNKFLQTVFASRLQNGGIDISKISNISILSKLQYESYVQNVVPLSSISFMLSDLNPDNEEQVCQVNPDGTYSYIGIREQTGFRPCVYIDYEYLKSVTGLSVINEAYLFLQTNIDVQHEKDQTAEADKAKLETEQKSAETAVFEPEKEKDVLIGQSGSDEQTLIRDDSELIVSKDESTQEDKTSIQKESDNFYEIHLYQNEFEDFSMIYDGSDERIKKIIEKQGISIGEFTKNSRNDNRSPVNKDDIVEKIRKMQSRWTWKQ